jgi:hypothetical protein
VKNFSGHIYFANDFNWKDLGRAFLDIWDIFSSETKQNQEEAQYDQISLELNLLELKKNKKPIGYIKDGAKFRLVFPRNRKEIIVFKGIMSEDIAEITESVSKILKEKKIKNKVAYDKMLLYEIHKRRK